MARFAWKTWIAGAGAVSLAAVLLAAVPLAGCGGRDGEGGEIRETRVVTDHAADAAPHGMSTAERLGVRQGEGGLPAGHPDIGSTGGGGGTGSGSVPPAAAAPPSSGLAWTAPEGWKKEGPRPMREVSFRTGPGDAVECYVTVLAGAGGGAAANINRWRAQMGHPALSEQEIASLPRVEILGRPSPVVEIAGDYSGMGSSTQASALLYGAICELGTRTVFVKMIGPEGATRPEKDRFLAFCKSLH